MTPRRLRESNTSRPRRGSVQRSNTNWGFSYDAGVPIGPARVLWGRGACGYLVTAGYRVPRPLRENMDVRGPHSPSCSKHGIAHNPVREPFDAVPVLAAVVTSSNGLSVVHRM